MKPEIIDVLIVEDEHQLALLYAEMLERHPWLRLVGIASSLENAKQLLKETRPGLMLLDNYLPDGEGITLLDEPEVKSLQCSIIFITAANDMNTCSAAIRGGAFDYLLKPFSWQRLDHSLARFINFFQQQCISTVLDQNSIDTLFALQGAETPNVPSCKGIEDTTLQKVLAPFNEQKDSVFSVDDISALTGLSKTTLRRYMEYAVSNALLSVEKCYGQPGQPRRVYRWVAPCDNV